MKRWCAGVSGEESVEGNMTIMSYLGPVVEVVLIQRDGRWRRERLAWGWVSLRSLPEGPEGILIHEQHLRILIANRD